MMIRYSRGQGIPHAVMLKEMAKKRKRLKTLVVAQSWAKAKAAHLEAAGQAGLESSDSTCNAQQPERSAESA